MGEGGNYGAGTSPAGALAHGPCCHTKGGSIRVGLKDGGKRERFFFFSPLRWSRCPYMGKPLSSWGAVLLYALVCGMTNQPINKNGRLAGRVGRCTYMVKPPGVFPERFVRAVGEGEQVHLHGEATRMYWGTLSLVCCMANVEPISIKSNMGWQVHLYGEAARCVPEISNPRGVEGEPGRCT